MSIRIKPEPLLKCFQQISYYLDGVVQGANEWCPDEYTRDMLTRHRDEIQRVINVFKAEHMVDIAPIDKEEPLYIKLNEQLPRNAESLQPHEVVTEYKAQLYYRILNYLKKLDCSSVPGDKLQNWIEENVVLSKFANHQQEAFYSDNWFYTSFSVLQDVTKKIIRDRERTPQQQLFKD